MANEPKKRFSARHGFASKGGRELTREDAPETVRCGLMQIVLGKLKLRPSWLRRVVCGVLRVRPDPSNWSEYPNVHWEVEEHLHTCAWFRVYDIIEAISGALNDDRGASFEEAVNELFSEEGIGWQLVGGELRVRGDEAFETVIDGAAGVLENSKLSTAASELREAIHDLSRRPEADLSGAVHHAMSALEIVARGFSGDAKRTLGGILKKHRKMLPSPIGDAVAKLWGYASDQARHGKESRQLAWEEAQLIVGISAVVCSYLTQKGAE